MLLQHREWGPTGGDSIVCVHGVTQHGGIFEPLGRELAQQGYRVIAVDLRGHGSSDPNPPWNIESHVEDLLETADALGIQQAAWMGHSFGCRLGATIAARLPERVTRLALLEPGLQVPPDLALRHAEIDRLDWSFATIDGAVNALLASSSIVATPRDVVAAYVNDDVQRGTNGRFKFSYCPSAAVVAWSEMTTPAPPVAEVPTQLLLAMVPLSDHRDQLLRYRKALGPLLTVTTVPNGHNVLWEAPAETIAAVGDFLSSDRDSVV